MGSDGKVAAKYKMAAMAGGRRWPAGRHSFYCRGKWKRLGTIVDQHEARVVHFVSVSFRSTGLFIYLVTRRVDVIFH